MRRCSAAASSRRAKPDGSPAAPHPAFKPHPMQGWTPDFIPKLTGDAVDMELIDRILPIPGADAIRCSQGARRQGRHLRRHHLRRAPLPGALQIAAEAPKGATILCMLPDTGERYLSTPLFADVPADMTEEELEISRSTPADNFQPRYLHARVPPTGRSPDENSCASTACDKFTIGHSSGDNAGNSCHYP